MKKLENAFEFVLWYSRLVFILAVIASIASAFILVFMGTIDILQVITDLWQSRASITHPETLHKAALVSIISAIDFYLIATVLLIFGIGLYELFIRKLEIAENDVNSSRILIIHSLDELKEKIAKVVIMVLIVVFFQYAINIDYKGVLELLPLAGGIFLISLAVYFTHQPGSKKEKK